MMADLENERDRIGSRLLVIEMGRIDLKVSAMNQSCLLPDHDRLRSWELLLAPAIAKDRIESLVIEMDRIDWWESEKCRTHPSMDDLDFRSQSGRCYRKRLCSGALLHRIVDSAVILLAYQSQAWNLSRHLAR